MTDVTEIVNGYPQTYMPTLPAVIGLNSSFCLVSVLYIFNMISIYIVDESK